MPTSGSARRRTKANRRAQAVAVLTCKIQGHVWGSTFNYCLRCGGTR